MKLKFITDETLMDLRTNYDAYKTNYYKADHNWFDEYFKEEGRVLESSISFEMPTLNMDEDYSVSDRENVQNIYESLNI